MGPTGFEFGSGPGLLGALEPDEHISFRSSSMSSSLLDSAITVTISSTLLVTAPAIGTVNSDAVKLSCALEESPST